MMIDTLRCFNVISDTTSIADKQRIGIGLDGNLAKVDEAGFFKRGSVRTVRNQTQTEENNAVRTALLEALTTQFNGQIPKSVLDTLNGSSLFGGKDMKTGDDGKVISGRPLTARRIRAVMTAVKAELDKGLPLVSRESVRPKLGELALARSAYPNAPEVKLTFDQGKVEKYLADRINGVLRKAAEKGWSGQTIVSQVAKSLYDPINMAGTNDVARYYFPQVAENDSQASYREAVSDFLVSLGIDVNQDGKQVRDEPKAPFEAMPGSVNGAGPVKGPSPFKLPSNETIAAVVKKRIDNNPNVRFKGEQAVQSHTRYYSNLLKGILDKGVTSRSEIEKQFSSKIFQKFHPTINSEAASVFPELVECYNQVDGIQQFQAPVSEFLDEIGLVAQ